MQKVYRLLRNNQETGPYTLEEILLLNLKAFDLVWLDGKSAAWRYPSEIEALKPFVPAVPQSQSPFEPVATAALEKEEAAPIPKIETSGKIFVSMPQKAQGTIRQPEPPPVSPVLEQSTTINAARPEETPAPVKEIIQTKYSKSLDEIEEDYTKWTYNKKSGQKTGISKKDLSIAALVVVLIVSGYFILSKPSVIQPLTQEAATPVKTTEQVVSQNSPSITAQPEIVNVTPAVINDTKKKKSISPKRTTAFLKINDPGNQPEIQNEAAVNVATKETAATTTQTSTPEKTTATTNGKKKKFGQVVKGIFSKKDKNQEPKDETVLQDPQPATNRQSTKRNTGSETVSEPNNEALASMVDITSNAPDNWMMGVSGLKLTIRNRNSVALQTAAVQVLYYDENDQLLDRKSVYFNNVPAKGKSTVGAPDHKFADHVEFKLLAVSARDDHFASN
jgi:hypothetical protein